MKAASIQWTQRVCAKRHRVDSNHLTELRRLWSHPRAVAWHPWKESNLLTRVRNPGSCPHAGACSLTMVETEGLEPSSPQCKSGVFPLDHVPGRCARRDSNPRSPGCRPGDLAADPRAHHPQPNPTACRDPPFDDKNLAVPTAIEPVSTLLDERAAYPDAYGTGQDWGDHRESNPDQEDHSLPCEPLHHGHHVKVPPAAIRTPILRLSSGCTSFVLRAVPPPPPPPPPPADGLGDRNRTCCCLVPGEAVYQ